MGKIRLKVVGDETAEQEQKQKVKAKKEGKKARGLNMGGGQRINTVGPSEEEVMAQSETEQAVETKTETEGKEKKARGKKARAKAAKIKSKRYSENASHVAKNTSYPLKSGIEILRKFKKGGFDETVELHINVKEKGISGQVSLPHGTGKKLRIAIADDALIAQIEQGKIDFDILIATPQMMPKLARVAKILGPRGLMPNPKAGTITEKPEELTEKLSAGQVSYKTDPQAPVIHMSVGKLSFEDKQLSDNIKTVLSAIASDKIANITLKSTMSPAIKINFQ